MDELVAILDSGKFLTFKEIDDRKELILSDTPTWMRNIKFFIDSNAILNSIDWTKDLINEKTVRLQQHQKPNLFHLKFSIDALKTMASSQGFGGSCLQFK